MVLEVAALVMIVPQSVPLLTIDMMTQHGVIFMVQVVVAAGMIYTLPVDIVIQ